jgi:hypothetical protein
LKKPTPVVKKEVLFITSLIQYFCSLSLSLSLSLSKIQWITFFIIGNQSLQPV